MPGLVGVRFGRTGPVRYFDPRGLDLSVGDRVMVETDDGDRPGTVVIAPGQVLYSALRGPLAPVLQLLPDDEEAEAR